MLWMLSTWTLGKPFGSISHCILLEKLAAHGLGGCICLLGKKLAGWPGLKSGRVNEIDIQLAAGPQGVVFPKAQHWGQFFFRYLYQ